MDFQKALDQLARTMAVIDSWGAGGAAAQRQFEDQVVEELAVSREIAKRLDFGGIERLQPFGSGTGRWKAARDRLAEIHVLLDRRAEIDAMLPAAGPRLAAASLHELVWSSAARLWDGGHHVQALQTASVALEGLLQGELQRPQTMGQDLAAAFSPDPPTESWPRRLRFVGLDPNSLTFKSAQDGAVALVRGAFLYVRNLASHPGAHPIDETEALEQLAVLSLVARVVDRCTVIELSD